jgi:protein-tyrosine kinase
MSIIENAIDRLRRVSAASPTAPRAGPGSASAKPSIEEAEAPPAPQRRIAVDFNAFRSRGEIPEVGEERRFADYYREIKRPLIERALASDARPDARLILVTSALPAEGKTFTALNLALSIAHERDVSVLLVDADLPKAHLSRTFGIQDEPGLLDALSDSARDPNALVLGTDVAGLELLPTGKATGAAATELIASARMGQIVARLMGRHPRRLVLFDSPPLLVSSEARALKQLPGQILMVARAGKTLRQALLDAIAMVDKSRLYGLVLNDAYITGGDGYYEYYGYSGYSGYESQSKSGPAA